MHSKTIIYLILSTTSFITLEEDSCLFKTSENCITNNKECCKLQINDDIMCISKKQLLENYINKLKFKNQGLTDEEVKKFEDFDYKFKNNVCIKWIEANMSFFNDVKILSKCDCNINF